jgi:glycosyltransferase involved in cell wall biosynthesis
MKALVISWGQPHPEQQALWSSVARNGIDLSYIHTDLISERGVTAATRDSHGASYITLPVIRMRAGPTWWWYRGLREIVSSLTPRILHVLSEPWSTLVLQALVIRGRRRDISVVAHGCDNMFTHGNRLERAGRRMMLRSTLRRLDGYVSWNREGAELARRFGLPRECPTAVIPAIVPETSLFTEQVPSREEARSRFGLPADAFVIGYIGRLAQEKGIHDLLKAVQLLTAPSAYCAVWGAGPLESAAVSFFASHPTRGVALGAIPLGEVPVALRACDILVVPSRTVPAWKEQFGRIVVEAMLAGVPVVAYASGALREVVGHAGALIPEGDVEGLASALGSLINTPERRAAMSSFGRARVRERFSPKVLADQLIDFWSSAMTTRMKDS